MSDTSKSTDLSDAADGLDLGHVFDQTNGVIDDADGDSDGTARSDTESAAERDGTARNDDDVPGGGETAHHADEVEDRAGYGHDHADHHHEHEDHADHDHADHHADGHDDAGHDHDHGRHAATPSSSGGPAAAYEVGGASGPDTDAEAHDPREPAADEPGHVFDQTNGLAPGLEGESDGTAAGDLESDEDRRDDDPSLLSYDDAEDGNEDEGAADLRDPNP